MSNTTGNSRQSNNSRKSTPSSGTRSTSKTGTRSSSGGSRTSSGRQNIPEEEPIGGDLFLLLTIAVCIILFLCNFGIIGLFGNTVSNIMFGVFGLISYVLPIAAIVIILFRIFNRNNSKVTRKLAAGIILCLLLMMICDMATGLIDTELQISIPGIYARCAEAHKGGGVIGGVLAFYLIKLLGHTGTWLIVIVLVIVCILMIAGKSFIDGIREQGQYLFDETMEERRSRNLDREKTNRERMNAREERLARKKELNDAREAERRLKEEQKENDAILRMEKKSKGVTLNTTLEKDIKDPVAEELAARDDEHMIRVTDAGEYERRTQGSAVLHDSITGEGSDEIREIIPDYDQDADDGYGYDGFDEPEPEEIYSKPVHEITAAPEARLRPERVPAPSTKETAAKPVAKPEPAPVRKSGQSSTYKFPPLNLLKPGSSSRKNGDDKELKDIAERLVATLDTFGVKAKITDVFRGPAVTRYELQPELGVKVSKIVGLSDDLKLALAATDIRIEAPIPGKSAVGIEVPNKENEAVAFRDLVESAEFKETKASLPFAVGKDIGGKNIIHDIAKMPHVLIAGATGSGKSVCINTIIMSILYKCKPEDVRLIMIDPKVVELSVYNGIPHLLLPVVTDPKKAAGALQWAVKEMNDRYGKFATAEVRDLKGYNAKVEDPAEKLPYILIIVDELADLMMVAPGEVEESICRLAQLARACGIHLVLATQRPSVDVITGLIKANMPSRIAFAVSSGVDSRTILDMVGAEKLLGKGDMLFHPQGLPKPTRVQGAFVSDGEVSKVVQFFKELGYDPGAANDIESGVAEVSKASSGNKTSANESGENSDYDEYFASAGRFIIDKEKASIGALQRLLKIGFNRAARIMDQLAEAGVVGEEQGTKPREILMNEEQFEQLLSDLGIE